MCEISAFPALTLPSSKAKHICHNEDQTIFFHQAAFHHQHNTQRDLLMQSVLYTSFLLNLTASVPWTACIIHI